MARSILLVEGDLLARGRVEAAAEAAGWELFTSSTDGLPDALKARTPDLVVLDLDRGRERLLGMISEARSQGLLPEAPTGFVSHVDGALSRAAREAGIKPVARGRFWSQLAGLLD